MADDDGWSRELDEADLDIDNTPIELSTSTNVSTTTINNSNVIAAAAKAYALTRVPQLQAAFVSFTTLLATGAKNTRFLYGRSITHYSLCI